MEFTLNVGIDSEDKNIKNKCVDAVTSVLEEYNASCCCTYNDEEEAFGGLKMCETEKPTEYEERERKIVVEGMMNYSFGKNGPGLTDELLQIGELVKMLSKDNYVYLEDSFIDACDDVYDLKFHITPHEENEWMLEKDGN